MSRASPGEATAKPSSSRMRRAFATCAAFDSASCPRPSHKLDRKSTRLNSSHGYISYAVFCLKKINNDGIKLTQRRVASRNYVREGMNCVRSTHSSDSADHLQGNYGMQSTHIPIFIHDNHSL